eukprot:TRINITY_DN2717_c1_g1_i1.p4 TRINITY_DN2717_c1_g1~~TRINITY_DN2717_c1_g1_i1.p4  ORF type:complete len:250 (+),score=30.19 TRINITY_DN2717_c1_g1_i1:1413-2162(+)
MATFGYIKLDLYDLGDESDKLYFISKGELKKSVAVELKAHNRYPVGKAKWEVLTTTRKVLKEVGVLSPKDVVGQEELRTDGKRSHRVEATMDSRVYFITRTVYNKLFMDSEKEWLEQNAVKSLPPFKEAEGLSSNEYEMKFKVLKQTSTKQSEAILDAMRMNLPYKGYTDTGRCKEFTDKRQKKLLAWLNRLRKMKISPPSKKEPAARIIEVVRECKVVTKGHPYKLKQFWYKSYIKVEATIKKVEINL